MSETYTVKQVAEILGYSTNSIYSFLKEGRIKGVRIGKGRFRITREELDRHLHLSKSSSKQKTGPPPEAIAAPTVYQEEKPLLARYLFRTLDIPSLFDWFVGIGAISLGFSMFIFSKLFDEFMIERFITWILPIKVTLIVGGFGLLFSDISRETRSIWHSIFHTILVAAFISLAVIMFAIQDLDGWLLFGLLAIVMIVNIVVLLESAATILMYIGLLVIFLPPILIISSNKLVLPEQLMGIFSSLLMIVAWFIFASAYIIFLIFIYRRRGLPFLLHSVFIGLILILTAVWYATQIYWGRSLFILTLALISFILPFWSLFQFSHSHDRRKVFIMFGLILVSFLIGIASVRLIQDKMIKIGNQDILQETDRTRIYLESRFDSIHFSLEGLSQNPLFIDAVEKNQEDVVIGLLRHLYESSLYMKQISLLSKEGNVLFKYPYGDSLGITDNLSLSEYFKKNGVPQTLKLIEVKTEEKSESIVVVSPIKDFVKGEIKGTIVGSLNLESLADFIQKLNLTKEKYVVLFDKTGKYFIHPDQSFINKKLEDNNPLRLALTGEKGVTEWYDYQNNKALVGYTIVSKTGWGLAVFQPMTDVLRLPQIASYIVFSLLLIPTIIIITTIALSKAKISFFIKQP